MVGGIESAGPERSTVVPRPADVPMTFLQPESRLLKVSCTLYSLNIWLLLIPFRLWSASDLLTVCRSA